MHQHKLMHGIQIHMRRTVQNLPLIFKFHVRYTHTVHASDCPSAYIHQCNVHTKSIQFLNLHVCVQTSHHPYKSKVHWTVPFQCTKLNIFERTFNASEEKKHSAAAEVAPKVMAIFTHLSNMGNHSGIGNSCS